MADNKKYYYLKLKENFYDTDAMILLEGMENGYMYSNILLKMYLRSLKTNGKLMYNDKIPYNTKLLSSIVRHNSDVVDKAIKIFKELDIIEILDNGAIYMSDIQSFIGKSTTEADRIRDYRKEIGSQKTLSCTNVRQMYDKCTPEIEIRDIKRNIKEKYYECTELDKIFKEYLSVRVKLKLINSDRAINTLINKLKDYTDDVKIKMIEQSIVNSWKSIYEIKDIPKKVEKKFL